MSLLDRRGFLTSAGLGVTGAIVGGPRAAWPDERAMARAASETDSFVLLRREQARRRGVLPAPGAPDRLPLTWYQAKARAIKEEARRRGVTGGVFLTGYWNIVYVTGLLHSTTERPFACFLPMDEEDGLVWLHPYLDQELVTSWWATGTHAYFDWHPTADGFPNEGRVTQGSTVNVYRWWGETLARLGYGDRVIGIDGGSAAEIGLLPGQTEGRLDMFGKLAVPTAERPTGGKYGQMAAAMPDARFVDVYDILIRHRMVKDDAEHRLTQRAMDYFSEIHAFARNYLLERGLGTLDWEIENAAQLWGMHRIMQDIEQDGTPHRAVGISVSLGCRTGPKTAYPHPNQASWARVERGHALQLAGVVRVGGYGGEQYRSFLIAPWTDWQEKVWDVHTATYFLQAERSRAGATCASVAQAVHDYQVANGVQQLVYHRPGHGEGMEGHQPPYQALGDSTLMQSGMHFSNEPGLYDPTNRFGFNHSNNVLVTPEGGLQMGTVPADREWCFLQL